MIIVTPKLTELAKSDGCDNPEEWVGLNMFSSVVMGICRNKDCDYTTDVEPDCRRGHCEMCNTKTVESGLSLSGMV